MPKIKSLCTACEESFSVDGPISEEALQRVLTILGEPMSTPLKGLFLVCNIVTIGKQISGEQLFSLDTV
jgi:hypothetical protein